MLKAWWEVLRDGDCWYFSRGGKGGWSVTSCCTSICSSRTLHRLGSSLLLLKGFFPPASCGMVNIRDQIPGLSNGQAWFW